MTVSRETQPTHDLIVPLIVFCIGEDAERHASSVLQKSKRHICKVILSSRQEITARLIRSYRAQLQISRNIIVPVLMDEGNTLYQIMYDNKTKIIECLDCIIYKIAC